MYEAVHAHPDGDATVSRFARTAARQGYEGIVVRTRDAEFDAEAVREEYGVDVVDGAEVRERDPGSAGGAVGNFRPDVTVLLVRGGDDAINRFAVEADRADVLTRPMADRGGFNHVLAKAAARHGTYVEFDFGPVLRKRGGDRVRALSNLRKLREIVAHYETPFVVSANATSHLELRAPRELIAVGEAVGFSAAAVESGLAAWAEIVGRTRKRRSGEFIAPGVERGRYEEDG